MKIFMSGPIRPSEESVIDLIQSLRNQIPNCEIFLSTWKNDSKIRKEVDHYIEIPEPILAFQNNARTIQQRQIGLADEYPGCKYSIFKMFVGVEQVCRYAQTMCNDDDIVMRIRTDSVFTFEPGYLTELIQTANDSYIARQGDGFDWFGLTTFRTMKKVWCFPSLEEYTSAVIQAWNAEDVVKRQLAKFSIPIRFLDPSKVDYYILREHGRKHYYS